MENLYGYTSDYGFYYNKLLRFIAYNPVPIDYIDAMETLDKVGLLYDPVNPDDHIDGKYNYTEFLEILENIKNLYDLFDIRPPLTKHKTVYSGRKNYFDQVQETHTITFTSFLSTTADINIATEYIPEGSDCCLFVINLDPGNVALYDMDEDQWVLIAGTRLKVDKIYYDTFKTYECSVDGIDMNIRKRFMQWYQLFIPVELEPLRERFMKYIE